MAVDSHHLRQMSSLEGTWLRDYAMVTKARRRFGVSRLNQLCDAIVHHLGVAYRRTRRDLQPCSEDDRAYVKTITLGNPPSGAQWAAMGLGCGLALIADEPFIAEFDEARNRGRSAFQRYVGQLVDEQTPHSWRAHHERIWIRQGLNAESRPGDVVVLASSAEPVPSTPWGPVSPWSTLDDVFYTLLVEQMQAHRQSYGLWASRQAEVNRRAYRSSDLSAATFDHLLTEVREGVWGVAGGRLTVRIDPNHLGTFGLFAYLEAELGIPLSFDFGTRGHRPPDLWVTHQKAPRQEGYGALTRVLPSRQRAVPYLANAHHHALARILGPLSPETLPPIDVPRVPAVFCEMNWRLLRLFRRSETEQWFVVEDGDREANAWWNDVCVWARPSLLEDRRFAVASQLLISRLMRSIRQAGLARDVLDAVRGHRPYLQTVVNDVVGWSPP